MTAERNKVKGGSKAFWYFVAGALIFAMPSVLLSAMDSPLTKAIATLTSLIFFGISIKTLFNDLTEGMKIPKFLQFRRQRKPR